MKLIRRVTVGIALIAATLSAADRRHYTPQEKAYYMTDAQVDYVRPGLTIAVNSAKIASDGTITVVYTVSDPSGLGLDSTGTTSPGTISLSFLCDVLPNSSIDYQAYTLRASSGAAGTFNRPSADSGGTATSLGNGQYQYVYATKAPSGFDATATHTIGIYGSRNLSVFSLPTNYASVTYNFVPNGAKVTHTHDVIRTASCNTCHDQLSHHGGARRGLDMCVLCHNPGLIDTGTGASVDAKVAFHQLHMGASLPGLKLPGGINNVGGTDYSGVVFPADPGDPRRCTTCHSQTTGAAQATAYLTNPSRAACGACHNTDNFATGVNHPGGPQFDDKLCADCHIPQGEMDFDASIMGAHVAPTASSLLSGLAVAIVKVTNSAAGQKPVVAFTVKDGKGNPLALSALSSISFTMGGPTVDYGYTSFGSDVTTPGYVTESASASTCDSSGNCTYNFTHAVPAKSTGTYAIGVEARRSETVLAGTTSSQTITEGTPNKVVYFSVDGSAVNNRRAVVALANCNQCHVNLQVHGGLRNNTEYCVMCHNPSNTDASTRVSATVAADKAAPPEGINFNLLVHRIHYGTNMTAAGRSYVVVGFGGSHNDFSNTLFPAMGPTGNATDLANCSLCHVNSTEMNDLTLTGLNQVTDPQGPLNPVQPFTSACTGCHVTIPDASHALSNTTILGEACAVCHSSTGAYAVDAIHAQY